MAEVFEATDLSLRRRVAIKRLAPATMADATARLRFAREARALARVGHPNVVAVFDAVEDGGQLFLVMELVDGTTLREVLDEAHHLDPERAASIASGICSALAAVHARGIVHRDVKPSNVFVTASGAVKLGDFGIARLESDVRLTRTGEVFGSAPYVAPEQVTGGPVDARTDLYSLGCVAFEMGTGRPPFEGDDPATLAYRHVHEPPPRADALAPWMPASLTATIDRLLSKDPADRPATAEEVRRSLDSIARRTPSVPGDVPTEPLTPAPETKRLPEPPSRGGSHQRRRALLWVAGLGSAIALVLVLVALFGGSRLASSGSGRPSPTLGSSPDASPAGSPASPAVSTSTPTTSASTTGSNPSASEALVGVVGELESSGVLGGRLARDLQHGVDAVIRALDKGDGEDVLRSLAEMQDKLDQGLERGEISPEEAHLVSDAIRQLASTIGESAGQGDEGD